MNKDVAQVCKQFKNFMIVAQMFFASLLFSFTFSLFLYLSFASSFSFLAIGDLRKRCKFQTKSCASKPWSKLDVFLRIYSSQNEFCGLIFQWLTRYMNDGVS